jgi:hypothetical protein
MSKRFCVKVADKHKGMTALHKGADATEEILHFRLQSSFSQPDAQPVPIVTTRKACLLVVRLVVRETELSVAAPFKFSPPSCLLRLSGHSSDVEQRRTPLLSKSRFLLSTGCFVISSDHFLVFVIELSIIQISTSPFVAVRRHLTFR